MLFYSNCPLTKQILENIIRQTKSYTVLLYFHCDPVYSFLMVSKSPFYIISRVRDLIIVLVMFILYLISSVVLFSTNAKYFVVSISHNTIFFNWNWDFSHIYYENNNKAKFFAKYTDCLLSSLDSHENYGSYSQIVTIFFYPFITNAKYISRLLSCSLRVLNSCKI